VVIVFVFIVRIPSFVEPFYYGDEMIYLDLGEGVRRGMTLYKDVHDNKPPLLYYLAAIAGNVFTFRVILALWMMATTILFWHFCRALFKSNRSAIASTVCFAVLTSLPFFEGHIANAELFMIAPTVGAFYLIWKNNSLVRAFAAGVLIAIAALFKIPSIFDAGVIVGLWIFALQPNKKSIRLFLTKSICFGLGIALPMTITFVWYALKGSFSEYLTAAFLQNFGYVNTWRGQATAQVPFLVKNGPILLRGIVVLAIGIVLFFTKRRRSTVFVLGCLWVATSLFAATLSERPYPHYFVQLLPSFSLLLGLLFTDETKEQALVIFPLTLLFFVPVYFGFWNYSTSHYVRRFQTYVNSGFSLEYLNEFGDHTNRNYEVANYIKTRTGINDRVFVWGDSSAIYALSNRLPPIKYVADYHIRDFSSVEETLSALRKAPPAMVVILSEAALPEELLSFTEEMYTEIHRMNGAAVWYNTKQ